jgi:hypothetical protein
MVEQGLSKRDDLAGVQRLRADQHRRGGTLADGLHRRGLLPDRLLVDTPDILDRGRRRDSGRRELHLRAAGEVDAQVEAPEDDRADAHQDEGAEQGVPQLALSDDVEGAGAGVEARQETGPRPAVPPHCRIGHLSLP